LGGNRVKKASKGRERAFKRTQGNKKRGKWQHAVEAARKKIKSQRKSAKNRASIHHANEAKGGSKNIFPKPQKKTHA